MSNRRLPRLLAAALVGLPLFVSAAAPLVEVLKTPGCGCCEAWVKHLRDNGLSVTVREEANLPQVRAKAGIPEKLGSCHTATVAGYAIEGHVPAADIKRLLATKPKARGLAVPGMPMGSPGMEAPQHDAYDVLLVRDGGRTEVYRHYN